DFAGSWKGSSNEGRSFPGTLPSSTTCLLSNLHRSKGKKEESPPAKGGTEQIGPAAASLATIAAVAPSFPRRSAQGHPPQRSRLGLPLRHRRFVARGRVPDLHGSVPRGAGKAAVVRAVGYAPDPARVPPLELALPIAPFEAAQILRLLAQQLEEA